MMGTTISAPTWEGKAYLTATEVCAYLRVSRTTLRQWAKLYRLKRAGRGKVVRYSVAEVRRLEERVTRAER